ncbi:N-acetylglucosamine kinase [Microbacterium sp. 22242]|uniref:N-acetylglucosamine kinase n=1 Tax=Microbacterium sp. 22242 TaxID=3453896 RepID=UPI003F862FCC
MLVLGVDAGGTSTRAVLAAADGVCLGYGRGGSGNPTSSGVLLALDGVLRAIGDALQASGAELSDVTGMAMAMAGHDAGGGTGRWLLDALQERGFRGALRFESDLLAMYASGTVAPVGCGIVCGTGASAVRVEDGRIAATADGLGWLLGDRGSGFWIGRRAAHAAVDQLEGVGPETALTPLVLRACGVPVESAADPGRDGRPSGLERLIRSLYAQRPVQLAALAPLVFDAAEAQDLVAASILAHAGELLVQTLGLVRDRPGPVVAGGSIVLRDGPPQRALREHLAATPGQDPVVLVDSGAAGATMLALRHAGAAVDEGTLARLRAGIAGRTA